MDRDIQINNQIDRQIDRYIDRQTERSQIAAASSLHTRILSVVPPRPLRCRIKSNCNPIFSYEMTGLPGGATVHLRSSPLPRNDVSTPPYSLPPIGGVRGFRWLENSSVMWPNLHHIRSSSWLREASWLWMEGSYSSVWPAQGPGAGDWPSCAWWRLGAAISLSLSLSHAMSLSFSLSLSLYIDRKIDR